MLSPGNGLKMVMDRFGSLMNCNSRASRISIWKRLADELAGGWWNALLSVYTNKYGEAWDLTVAEWLKRSRFLQQRGFSGEMIKALFKDLKIKLSGWV